MTDPRTQSDQSRSRSLAGLPVAAVLLLTAGGCVQQMADQPRVDTLEASAFFEDGMSVRPQVPGTVARGQLTEKTPESTGLQDGKPIETIPIDVTSGLLALGQKHYGIWCSHCHGPAGYGNGMVVQRGFPAPPSYHIDRLRDVADGHIFRVITDGQGRMPKFGRRIPPEQRWAITAYVRALQLSQNAPSEDLDPADREQLESGSD